MAVWVGFSEIPSPSSSPPFLSVEDPWRVQWVVEDPLPVFDLPLEPTRPQLQNLMTVLSEEPSCVFQHPTPAQVTLVSCKCPLQRSSSKCSRDLQARSKGGPSGSTHVSLQRPPSQAPSGPGLCVPQALTPQEILLCLSDALPSHFHLPCKLWQTSSGKTSLNFMPPRTPAVQLCATGGVCRFLFSPEVLLGLGQPPVLSQCPELADGPRGTGGTGGRQRTLDVPGTATPSLELHPTWSSWLPQPSDAIPNTVSAV